MLILAVSGSLRLQSSNTAVIRAASRLAPAGMEFRIYDGLATLPPFNPDQDTDPLPAPVYELRQLMGLCDGLFVSSPEYARGVAGVMKNALDWLVSSLEFPGKPVALINASQRATDADAQLRLILQTMSANLVESASITIPLLGRNLDADGIVADAGLAGELRVALDHFAQMITLPTRSSGFIPAPDAPLR